MSSPQVSVVVPVYNPGRDIDDCIRSLLDQSLDGGEYEVIFVDDGSTDATPARLDELAAEHAWLLTPHRLFRKEHLTEHGLFFPRGRGGWRTTSSCSARCSGRAGSPCWPITPATTGCCATARRTRRRTSSTRRSTTATSRRCSTSSTSTPSRDPDPRRSALPARARPAAAVRPAPARAARAHRHRRAARTARRARHRARAARGAGRMPAVRRRGRAAARRKRRRPGRPARVHAREALAAARPARRRLAGGSLDATGAFDANDAHVLMREAEGVEEFLVPAAVRTRAIRDGSGDVRLALDIDARIDAASLAAGGRLPSGRYVLRTVMHVAGFRFSVPVTRGRRAMLLTLAVDDRGRAKPARPTLKQALAAWAPGIRGLIVRAKQSLRR